MGYGTAANECAGSPVTQSFDARRARDEFLFFAPNQALNSS
jgi:hypothetical protein